MLKSLAIVLLILSVPLHSQSSTQDPSKEAARAVAEFLEAAKAVKAANIEALADRVVALGSLATGPLLKDLSERSPRQLTWILKILRNLEAKDLRAEILPLTAHPDGDVRAEALRTALEVRPDLCTEAVISLAKDKHLEARKVAYNGFLVVPADDRFLPLLFDGLRDKDFWCALQAQRGLAMWPEPKKGELDPIIGGLHRNIGHLPGTTALQMIDIVKQRRDSNIDELLITGMGRGTDEVKVALLEAAIQHRSKAIVKQASDHLLLRSAPELVVASLRYLGSCKYEGSLATMADLLGSGNKSIRDAAAVALRTITGQLFGYDQDKWSRWISTR